MECLGLSPLNGSPSTQAGVFGVTTSEIIVGFMVTMTRAQQSSSSLWILMTLFLESNNLLRAMEAFRIRLFPAPRPGSRMWEICNEKESSSRKCSLEFKHWKFVAWFPWLLDHCWPILWHAFDWNDTTVLVDWNWCWWENDHWGLASVWRVGALLPSGGVGFVVDWRVKVPRLRVASVAPHNSCVWHPNDARVSRSEALIKIKASFHVLQMIRQERIVFLVVKVELTHSGKMKVGEGSSLFNDLCWPMKKLLQWRATSDDMFYMCQNQSFEERSITQ